MYTKQFFGYQPMGLKLNNFFWRNYVEKHFMTLAAVYRYVAQGTKVPRNQGTKASGVFALCNAVIFANVNGPVSIFDMGNDKVI